jgi:hypothetical protein
VTGVPAGKTLAGLNRVTRRADAHKDENVVFLSGNAPLVATSGDRVADVVMQITNSTGLGLFDPVR